jgi:spermidine/putrescine transport system substrate-binding protein
MGHEYDGSSIDLERALTRYMLERRVSRRRLLDLIGRVGAAAALAPVVAACTGGASSAPSAAASSAASAASSAPASAAPTPAPSPEPELYVYNWTEYIGEDVVPSFEEKYGVSVTYDFFTNTDEAYAKLGSDGGGYDVSFPIGVDIPDLIAKGALVALDKGLLPNIVNLGAEWTDPGYDPGNTYSVPYMWWTTGVGYAPSRVEGTPTSSKLLWDPRLKGHIMMLDDWQEVFALALIQLGYDANTADTAELDAALALLQEQKPLVRDYSTDTTTVLLDSGYWAGQMWGADLYQIAPEREDWAYFVPEEGGVRGSDTVAIFSGAKHPIAAHLFLNHLLDARVSASNTNYIGYMGPNAAAREFISPEILDDPAVNPDQAIVDKLQELLDLEPAVREEYLSRWQTLQGQ